MKENIIEEFKVLMDYPAYRISNLGNIQSCWCMLKGKGIGRICKRIMGDKWKPLKLTVFGRNGSAYKGFNAYNGISPKIIRIHTTVAKYFIGDMPAWAQCVRHLDGDSFNNCYTNLAYGTDKDNAQDRRLHGNWRKHYKFAKLTLEQVLEIKEKILQVKEKKKYSHFKKISEDYGVCYTTICHIATGFTWKQSDIEILLKEKESKNKIL